jgi:hypothetical protein
LTTSPAAATTSPKIVAYCLRTTYIVGVGTSKRFIPIFFSSFEVLGKKIVLTVSVPVLGKTMDYFNDITLFSTIPAVGQGEDFTAPIASFPSDEEKNGCGANAYCVIA